LTHTYRLENTGKKDLRLLSILPWRRTRLLYADRVIPAGEQGKITVELKTRSFSGPLKGGVTLRTNDPEKKLYRLTATVQVIPLIEAQPDRIFLSGVSGESLSSSVTITARKKATLTLTPYQTPDEDRFSWDLREQEPGRSYEITVRCPKSSPQAFRDRLVFRSNYPERPYLALPVLIRVLPPVQTVPNEIHFGCIRLPRIPETAPGGPKTREHLPQKRLFIRLNQGSDLSVLEVQCDTDTLAWTVTPAIPGRAVRIDLRLVPESIKPGTLKATLRVKTNQKNGGFRIPVTATVMEPLQTPGKLPASREGNE
jgi:hypothetical protein